MELPLSSLITPLILAGDPTRVVTIQSNLMPIRNEAVKNSSCKRQILFLPLIPQQCRQFSNDNLI